MGVGIDVLDLESDIISQKPAALVVLQNVSVQNCERLDPSTCR